MCILYKVSQVCSIGTEWKNLSDIDEIKNVMLNHKMLASSIVTEKEDKTKKPIEISNRYEGPKEGDPTEYVADGNTYVWDAENKKWLLKDERQKRKKKSRKKDTWKMNNCWV